MKSIRNIPATRLLGRQLLGYGQRSGPAVLGILLRGFSMLSKLLLLVYVARHLSVEDVGTYGLVTASVGFFLIFMGFEFYIYGTRQVLSVEKSRWPVFFRDQLVFVVAAYLLGAPLLLVVFFGGLLPWSLLGWFYVLLFLEHLSQEIYRFLVAISRTTAANIMLFMRTGAWAYAVFVLMTFVEGARDLNVVWFGWTLGITISIMMGIVALRDLGWRSAWSQKIDWGWIKKGIPVGATLLVGTLAIKAIYTVDRYFLEHYWGNTTVGIYVFYSGMMTAIQAFIDAGMVVVIFPKMIAAYQNGETTRYRSYVTHLFAGTLFLLIVFIGLVVIFVQPLLAYVGHAEYFEHVSLLWVLLVASVIANLALVPHYVLYAKKRDKAIRRSNLIGFISALLLLWILVPVYGAYGAAVSLAGSALLIALLKSLAAFKEQEPRQPQAQKVSEVGA